MLTWIFAGLVTVVLGFAVFWILPDTPELAIGRWNTHDEARFLRLSHNLARGVTTNQPVNPNGKKRSAQWSFFVQVIKDWQIYLLAIVITSNSVPNYGLNGFLDNTGSTDDCCTLPLRAISALLSALYADRLTWRMPFLVSSQSLIIIAYSTLFVKAEAIKQHVALCYCAVYIACIGLYPITPGSSAWTINNLAGAEKRAMGIATMISIGNLGGVAGNFIFQQRESPKYPTGLGTSLAIAAAGMLAAFTLEYLY
ncbi:hypothetical protein IAQ61_010826 [Plenodomus lingam]|uniref:uncharacterized protein n=1 Tax=Leptosphaeria maculans TaxID=5022 RepID=UPI00332878E5|nr:hypothetical protein IAQ61_010826 [Plenodomus lingam]